MEISVPSRRDVRAQRDEAYRAIGRYVVQFSLLVASMRHLLASRLGRDDESAGLLDLGFGSTTAEPITNAFFAMCRTLVKLDEKTEKPIETWLRKHSVDECSRRNDITHGDWVIENYAWHGAEIPVPVLLRLKASAQDPQGPKEYKPEHIDEFAHEVEVLRRPGLDLRDALTGIEAEGHNMDGHPMERVSDALCMEGGRE